jgi:uncharacterized protein YlxW (UPF0749 family)
MAALGFALAVQVHSTRASASRFPAARQEELVRILDDLTARRERLNLDNEELQRSLDRLATGTDEGALDVARQRVESLGVLAGTVPAQGPGVLVTIRDPRHTVTAAVLLDAVEELRDAGAEAMQLAGVRVVASTSFVDADGGVRVGGQKVSAPYVIRAIGDAATLAEAMAIPGGVVDTVATRAGASAHVERSDRVVVDRLRPISTPRYARPADDGD